VCAICWSGGQIIPMAGIAWRYWSVNRAKPSRAATEPADDLEDADGIEIATVPSRGDANDDLFKVEAETGVGSPDGEEQHGRQPVAVG